MFHRNPAEQNPVLPASWQHQVLSEDDLIVGLCQYVSKNTNITAFFAAIDESEHLRNTVLQSLLDAIAAADYEAEVFSHPDCPNYVLYAIETKRIPFWTGMTAFIYLTALAQFTDKQALRPGDYDVKSIRDVTVERLMVDGIYTDFGKLYVAGVQDFLRAYGVKASVAEVREAVAKLPEFEKCLLRVVKKPAVEMTDDYDVNYLFNLLEGNVPFCEGGDGKTMLLPSHGIINLVLNYLSPQPLQMKPVLGSVGERTRNHLHAKDQHPVSLYLCGVKSNIARVHGMRSGPIPAWLHDVGHTLWGTLLGVEMRKAVFAEILPILESVCRNNDESAIEKYIQDVIYALSDALADYDLSRIFQFHDARQRQLEYLAKYIAKKLPHNLLVLNDIDARVKHVVAKAIKNGALNLLSEDKEVNPTGLFLEQLNQGMAKIREEIKLITRGIYMEVYDPALADNKKVSVIQVREYKHGGIYARLFVPKESASADSCPRQSFSFK